MAFEAQRRPRRRIPLDMDRRHFLTALGATALLPTTLHAEPTRGELAGDIDILRDALALHPGLHRYATPAQVAGRIAALRAAFAESGSQEARYLLLSRFLATIRCGHSYANFFNQKRAVAAALFDRPTRLPFRFAWRGGKMVVTADHSGTGQLPRGTIVQRVNGVPARDMLRRLLPYARADGHNDAKRVALLEVGGADSIEYFDVFHGLLFGAPAGGVYVLDVHRPDGRATRVEAPAIGLAERRAKRSIFDPAGDAPVWTWDTSRGRAAVLTMPSWALYDSKWDWRAWLRERLDSLGGRGLVIDLRDNEGGQDCGDAILARLTDNGLPDGGVRRLVRFRTTPAALDPYLDTWDQSFRRLGADAADLGNGFYRLAENGDWPIAAERPRLTGRVAVLIGPTNSSATFQFAQRAQAAGVARLFGMPTGGNRRGINGGCFFFVRLPASGLEFDLPLIGAFPPGHPPDAGIAPDVRIAETAADIAVGRDPVMTRALAWAAG